MTDQQVSVPTAIVEKSMWGTIFGTVTSGFRALNKGVVTVENLLDYTNEETLLIRDSARLERLPIRRQIATETAQFEADMEALVK